MALLTSLCVIFCNITSSKVTSTALPWTTKHGTVWLNNSNARTGQVLMWNDWFNQVGIWRKGDQYHVKNNILRLTLQKEDGTWSKLHRATVIQHQDPPLVSWQQQLTCCSPSRCSCSSGRWAAWGWWRTPPASPRACPGAPPPSRSWPRTGWTSSSRSLEDRRVRGWI